MKILVAIPVYDCKLPTEAVHCLLNEQAIGFGGGDAVIVRFVTGCSHPAVGRNHLVAEFMASDADRLVFLDSDITFEPGALIRIAKRSADFVGGAYRLKQENEQYPVGWLDKPVLQATEDGLLEAAWLPAGFLSLSRKVFETLRDAHPDRAYSHLGKPAHCFFQMPFVDGTIYSEDSFFCKEWRNAGGKVYLDPELTLTHWDFNRPYVGHIGNWLKRGAGLLPAA